jgi:hypothetical protein
MAENRSMVNSDSARIVAKSLEIARERWVDLQDVLAGARHVPFVMDDEGTGGEGTDELSLPDLPATGRVGH